MKKSFILTAAVAILFYSISLFASDWSFTPRVGYEKVQGETSYEINFPFSETFVGNWGFLYFVYGTGKSKLDFDIDASLLNLGFDIGHNIKDNRYIEKTTFRFDYYTSTDTPEGEVSDGDWVYTNWGNYTIGDTLSSSESPIKIFDLCCRTDFLPINERMRNVNFFMNFGYMQQKIGTFKVINLVGEYYDPISDVTTVVNDRSGTAYGTYEVTYKIPYFGIGMNWEITRVLSVQGQVDYSPLVQADDVDQHLARGKTSRADCTGDYLSVKGELDWKVYKSLVLALEGKHISIDTSGTQLQSGGELGGDITVDARLKSEQTYYGVKLMYTF